MQIKTGDSPMALTVLTSLVDAYMKTVDTKDAARSMAALDAEFNLVEVIVSSLEVRTVPGIFLLWIGIQTNIKYSARLLAC